MFRLLGPLEVVRDSVSVPLGPGKQRILLTALLLDPGRAVSIDRLVTLLWDEQPPLSAVANIRNYTARLRALLTDPLSSCGSRLVRRKPGYLVAADPAELDVRLFTSLATEGRRALAHGPADQAEHQRPPGRRPGR
jgi:DNA-binding SARP family transcriptional activator